MADFECISYLAVIRVVKIKFSQKEQAKFILRTNVKNLRHRKDVAADPQAHSGYRLKSFRIFSPNKPLRSECQDNFGTRRLKTQLLQTSRPRRFSHL